MSFMYTPYVPSSVISSISPMQQTAIIPVNEVDTRQSYREITREFCTQYYTMYDNSFLNLVNFYVADSSFTYLDEEFVGFYNLIQRLKQCGIWKFTHHHINVNSQPVGQRGVLITVTGTISVNSSLFQNRFSETILLQRDSANKFYVYNTIFRLLE